MLKKALSFLLSLCFMLSLHMQAFADAALPPGYIDRRDSKFPMIAVLIAAVVILAAVIIIRGLYKKGNQPKDKRGDSER